MIDKYNKAYFSDMSLQSSYWAGFIAADGNISKYNKTTGLMINLKSEDESILHRFRKDANCQSLVRSYSVYSKQTNKHYAVSRFWVYGIQGNWEKDLFDIYNITKAKSLTLKPPIGLSEQNAKAFIIGYIDGDGGIRFKDNILVFQLLGTEEILAWVKQILSIDCNVKKAGYSKVFSFSIFNKKAKISLESLCEVQVERLERKWSALDQYKGNHE